MPKALSPEEQLLKIFSESASIDEKEKLKEAVQKKLGSTQQSKDEKALEAEAVLLYFHTKGRDFVKQKCGYKKCGKTFAYKYYIPGRNLRCSNECRRAELAEIGIEWTPNRSPEERWGMSGATRGHIPLIIPPTAYEIVESKLQEIHADNNSPVA